MKGGAIRFATALAGPALVALIPMAIAPALPAMAAEFAVGHDGAFFAQMILTMPAIMLILGAPIASLACERIGIRTTFIASAALFTLAGGMGLFVNGFAALATSRLLLGLAGGGIQTCTLALVGRWYDAEARHAVLGWMVSLASAVAIAGLVLGGWLVDLAGWRGPFALYLPGIVLLLLGTMVIERHAIGETVPDHGGFRPLLPLWPFYLAILGLTLAMFMPGIQGPFLIAERSNGSAALAGLVVAASPIGAVLSSASFSLLRRHVSSRGVLCLTAILLGGGCLIAAMSATVIGAVAGFAIIGLGAGLVEPNIGSIILGRSPHALHARASSLMISAMFLGQFLNPIAADPLRAGFGTTGAFWGIGGATMVAGLIFLLMRRGGKPVAEAE